MKILWTSVLLSGCLWATKPTTPTRPVVIHLTFQKKEPPQAFLRRLQREVEEIFAPAGMKLEWMIAPERPAAAEPAERIEVEMLGTCRLDWLLRNESRLSGQIKLGWTRVREGRVLPESAVDCDRIAEVVFAANRHENNLALLHGTYTRVVSRVMAHELMHALLRTLEHHFAFEAGHAVRPKDLLEPARLEPSQIEALGKILGREPGTMLARDPAPLS
jgi:hypothetical protein